MQTEGGSWAVLSVMMEEARLCSGPEQPHVSFAECWQLSLTGFVLQFMHAAVHTVRSPVTLD